MSYWTGAVSGVDTVSSWTRAGSGVVSVSSWTGLCTWISGGRWDSGLGSETLQTLDDRLLPIEVASIGEFHRLVVRDPEPEQKKLLQNRIS